MLKKPKPKIDGPNFLQSPRAFLKGPVGSNTINLAKMSSGLETNLESPIPKPEAYWGPKPEIIFEPVPALSIAKGDLSKNWAPLLA